MGRYSHLSIEKREDIMVCWRDQEGIKPDREGGVGRLQADQVQQQRDERQCWYRASPASAGSTPGTTARGGKGSWTA
jgi:hypothetical protein